MQVKQKNKGGGDKTSTSNNFNKLNYPGSGLE